MRWTSSTCAISHATVGRSLPCGRYGRVILRFQILAGTLNAMCGLAAPDSPSKSTFDASIGYSQSAMIPIAMLGPDIRGFGVGVCVTCVSGCALPEMNTEGTTHSLVTWNGGWAVHRHCRCRARSRAPPCLDVVMTERCVLAILSRRSV